MNRKRIIWGIVILLVLLFAYRIGTKILVGKEKTAEKAIPVMISRPVIGPVSQTLLLTGDIKGEMEVTVRPTMPGQVEEIYVDEGDYVKAGDGLLSYVKDVTPEDEAFEDVVTFSPIDGIVGVKMVKEGDQVMSGVGGINPVFTIYQIDQVKVDVDIPEKSYAAVSAGIPVQINLDAFPGEVFYGKVNSIRPVIDPYSRAAQAEIVMPNADHKIRPGMFCKVTLILQTKNNAVIVPTDAILGLGNEKYVFVVSDGRAEKKNVEVGIQEDSKSEILSGIDPVDQVITVGQRVVDNGSKVEVEKND